jgi:gamma-glutamylputrescine oxidase
MQIGGHAAAGYRWVVPEVSLWLDAPYTPRPSLDRDVDCAVCVVGAGIGGLATAWHLLARGVRDIVVVDGGQVAGGASGRNGGFFIAGAAPMYDRARELFGRARAAAIYRATLDAQQAILDVAQEVGARDAFRIVGMLRVDDEASIRAHLDALHEDGFEGLLTTTLPGALRGAGLLTPHDGAVHPARWLRALASALADRGVRIFENTRVLSPPSGQAVETAGGCVRAGAVVVAADAALGALVPALATRVRSRRLHMLATAPAPPALDCPVYVRDGHEYAQQLPDGRVTLGGFSDLDGPASWTDRAESNPAVQARLDAYLRDDLLVDAEVTHRWVGLVGYCDEPLPTAGAVGGGLFALGGYNGTGHVQAFVAARIVSDLIVDHTSADAWLYHPPMDDGHIQTEIDRLEERQRELRQREGELAEQPEAVAPLRDELEKIRVELDRLWDLHRQRRALREAGGNPDDASERDAGTVENYLS